jgi:hypothetical protein
MRTGYFYGFVAIYQIEAFSYYDQFLLSSDHFLNLEWGVGAT